jgi:uroporphyrinogen-III synthase
MLPLSGTSILVTRPIHQAGRLADGIAKAGGKAVLFPAVEIADVEDDARLMDLIGRMHEYDFAIFVSANAVEKAFSRMAALPAGLRCAAVGKATLAALEERGIRNILLPRSGFDSESLLELPELQSVAGSRIVIFRGEGGRELLADELKRRGAMVDYAECYRRIRPANPPALGEQDVQAVTATSGEIVTNLVAMTEGWIYNKPIFVTHERIGKIAKECGFDHVVVTEGGDDGLVKELLKWFEFGDKAHG